MTSSHVIVVGGGAIGLAVAWRASERGLRVTLVERDHFGAGASHVAAGMLTPISEAEYGAAGARQLELALASARRWPAFAEELSAASDTASQLRFDGTLHVARDADEAAALERALHFRRRLGLEVERLRASEARALEPALTPTLRLAFVAPTERSVEPRWLLDALAIAARRAGAELREGCAVVGLTGSRERVRGITLADGSELQADNVVIAAGAWSAALGGLPVRPVKGQILRLRDPGGPGLISRVIHYDGGYLVPRGDGRYVLGATVEERGFDVTVTVGAVYELLRDAAEVVPGILELELEDVRAGLRPGTPDNVPAIGPGSAEGLMWATGHYRNGILLAPLTAEIVVAALTGAQLPPLAAHCAPGRLEAGVPV